MLKNLDRRLWIILGLLVLSGLLYLSSNFKEIVETFKQTGNMISSQTGSLIKGGSQEIIESTSNILSASSANILSGGTSIPPQLLQSMAQISRILNN